MKAFEKEGVSLADSLLQLSVLACVNYRWLVKHLYHLVVDILEVLKILNLFYRIIKELLLP
jgi:hypothetical protein